MKKVYKNSDIQLNLSEIRGLGEKFIVKFYTTNKDFFIKKTDENVIEDYLKLNWNELETIGDGVLNYMVNNLTDDSGYDDGIYNSTFSGTTNYYIASNISVDDEDQKSYAEVIQELRNDLTAETNSRISADLTITSNVAAIVEKMAQNQTLSFYTIDECSVDIYEIDDTLNGDYSNATPVKTYQYGANTLVNLNVNENEHFEINNPNDGIRIIYSWAGICEKFHSWFNSINMFCNMVFNFNVMDHEPWEHSSDGETYQFGVTEAQYRNCVFWWDVACTNINIHCYMLHKTQECPLFYSTIPGNTYKVLFEPYNVTVNPNWTNTDFINSFSASTGRQAFAYSHVRSVPFGSCLDAEVRPNIITLPSDARSFLGLSTCEDTATFDCSKVTNFGYGRSGGQVFWNACYGATNLKHLMLTNLKTSIDLSWSPISNYSLGFIIDNAANTSAITINLSPYTWYNLTDAIKTAAADKNITLKLVEGRNDELKIWSDMMKLNDTQQTLLNMTIDGNVPVFTDVNGNSVTNGQAKVMFMDNSKDVVIYYNEYYFVKSYAYLGDYEDDGSFELTFNCLYNNTNHAIYFEYNTDDGLTVVTSSTLFSTKTCSYAYQTNTSTSTITAQVYGGGFQLAAGVMVGVTFKTNVGRYAYLNVNNTGNKPIYNHNAQIGNGVILAGDTAIFGYNSSNRWELLTVNSINNAAYSTVTPTVSGTTATYTLSGYGAYYLDSYSGESVNAVDINLTSSSGKEPVHTIIFDANSLDFTSVRSVTIKSGSTKVKWSDQDNEPEWQHFGYNVPFIVVRVYNCSYATFDQWDEH